jgi:hypothetical protein
MSKLFISYVRHNEMTFLVSDITYLKKHAIKSQKSPIYMCQKQEKNVFLIFMTYYRINEKLGQQNVVVMSTFQKCCSVTFLRTYFILTGYYVTNVQHVKYKAFTIFLGQSWL